MLRSISPRQKNLSLGNSTLRITPQTTYLNDNCMKRTLLAALKIVAKIELEYM